MFVDDQQPPWRALRAFPQPNGSTLVHLHNVSGGILSGDRLYRHRPASADSEQHANIRVGQGALLEYLPDVLIPFAASRHHQQTRITLADGAKLFWWETVAPGRQAMGETFAFDSLRIQTEVRSPTRPLLLEDLLLEPGKRPLTSAVRLGFYTHTASFYAFATGIPAAQWRELETQLAEFCSGHSNPGVMIWGTSALAADGIAVRGMSVSARTIPATLAAVWKVSKKLLTGEDAVLPRKVY
jgi:urease accessory protein